MASVTCTYVTEVQCDSSALENVSSSAALETASRIVVNDDESEKTKEEANDAKREQPKTFNVEIDLTQPSGLSLEMGFNGQKAEPANVVNVAPGKYHCPSWLQSVPCSFSVKILCSMLQTDKQLA